MPTLDDLLVFAATAGNCALVRERLIAGANINHIVPGRGTALFAAVGKDQCVALLLLNGADPNLFISEHGHTALDHALGLSAYGTAQGAFLIHCAGGRANAHSILPPPFPERLCQGIIQFSTGDWFTLYSVGQIFFARILRHNGQWLFDCGYQTTQGQFLRIEALRFAERHDIHFIERTDDGFMLVDHRGRRHAWTGSPDEIQIEATVSLPHSLSGHEMHAGKESDNGAADES